MTYLKNSRDTSYLGSWVEIKKLNYEEQQENQNFEWNYEMMGWWNYNKKELQSGLESLLKFYYAFLWWFTINESQYIALFLVSGSIKGLFSINYVNSHWRNWVKKGRCVEAKKVHYEFAQVLAIIKPFISSVCLKNSYYDLSL